MENNNMEIICRRVEEAAKATRPTDVWLKKETINAIFDASKHVFQGDNGTLVVTTAEHRFTLKFEGMLGVPDGESEEHFSYVRITALDDVYEEAQLEVRKKSCIIL